jgi:hypothetical protein
MAFDLDDHRGRLALDGIVIPQGMKYLPQDWRKSASLAMDAQPGLITAPNSGIPAPFTTYIDPKAIKVVYAPTTAAEFYGEEKVGDWTQDEAMFPLTELTGFTSAYNDFSQNGKAGANVNWESRQSFHFEVFTRWGEREMARYGEARLDWAALQSEASAETLNRAMNNAYFYGVTNLKCYGGLNDPSLPAAITPGTKAAGGYTWAVATALEIYHDFQLLYQQLQTQMPALVNMSSEMDCGIPNTIEPFLATNVQFGLTVMDMIKKAFPNVKFTVIPQFITGSGNLIQLKLRSVNGMPVTKAAFTEKMRIHPTITLASGWEQKKSAGTWGNIIRYPIAIVQMLGV